MSTTTGPNNNNNPTQDRLRLVPPPPVTTPEFDAVYDALTALYLAGPPIEPNNTRNTTNQSPQSDRVTGPMINAALGNNTLALTEPNNTDDDNDAATDDDNNINIINTTHQQASAKTPISQHHQPQQAVIELLLLAHLPVNAAAWAVQYVRDLSARSAEPVAYVRLQSGCACVELVGSRDTPSSSSTTELPSLKSAITEAAKHAKRWVVRVDTSAEQSAASAHDIDQLTLLTAADEAAIVGGYQSLKRLATTNTDATHAVNVVVVSADEHRGQAAADRIIEAATSFLSQPINTRVCPAKVSSFRAPALLFSGKIEAGPAELASLIRNACDHAAITTTQTATPTTTSTSASTATTTTTPPYHPTARPTSADRPSYPLHRRRGSVRTATLKPASATRPDDTVYPPQHKPKWTPALATNPLPLHSQPAQQQQQQQHTAAASTPATPTLPTINTTHTQHQQHPATPKPPLERLAGQLTPCNYACPFAPDIKLARDNAGTLHALAAASTAAELGTAIHDLLAAQAWANTNAQLLNQLDADILRNQPKAAVHINSNNTNSSNSNNKNSACLIHLFTTDPRIVARLLDTQHIILHALGRVQTERGPAWCAIDLTPPPPLPHTLHNAPSHHL